MLIDLMLGLSQPSEDNDCDVRMEEIPVKLNVANRTTTKIFTRRERDGLCDRRTKLRNIAKLPFAPDVSNVGHGHS